MKNSLVASHKSGFNPKDLCTNQLSMINQKIYQTQYYGFEVRVYFGGWGSR